MASGQSAYDQATSGSARIGRSPSPSNYEAKLLTGLVINQTNVRYPQIYPQSVSERWG
jgi:hypothetical protein